MALREEVIPAKEEFPLRQSGEKETVPIVMVKNASAMILTNF